MSPIDPNHRQRYCQPNTPRQCRYLAENDRGHELCVKLEPNIRQTVDQLVQKGKVNKTADNCSGWCHVIGRPRMQ